MYYETKEGDEELRLLYLSTQAQDEDDQSDEDQDEGQDVEQPQTKKPRKTRRSEASMLEEQNPIEQLSPGRPRRAAAARLHETNSGQRRIDEFLLKKRSPTKPIKPVRTDIVLPTAPLDQGQPCSVCDRRIPDDIFDVHQQACSMKKTETAKELMKKVQERTKTEAKIKEVLFARTTRQTVINELTRTNSDTTTCPECKMQMTVHRLETQHKNECQKARQ